MKKNGDGHLYIETMSSVHRVCSTAIGDDSTAIGDDSMAIGDDSMAIGVDRVSTVGVHVEQHFTITQCDCCL